MVHFKSVIPVFIEGLVASFSSGLNLSVNIKMDIMEKNIRTNPSQEQSPHNRPPQGWQNNVIPKEGDIRKVEESVEQAAQDDAYEVETEESEKKEE